MNKKELEILKGVVKTYVDLVDSGDAGFWNPHEEPAIMAAEELIKKHESTGQQTKTPHPSNPQGTNVQDGESKTGLEKRTGEGEDNKSIDT